MAAVGLHLENDVDSLELAPKAAAGLQKCVLLIEDNEEAMWLVKYAIQDYGAGRYKLLWANTLIGGLERISSGGVDVILLDLGLPESSGAESYAWVRQLAPETPVVVLTGDGRDETEFAVTASGADGYLVKEQVSGSFLLQAIRAALYKGQNRLRPHSITTSLFSPRFREDWK
jgi:DNA-binding NarL/FixJ family response regulator